MIEREPHFLGSVGGMTDREQLFDLPIRLGLSIDANDRDLYMSCWTTVDQEKVQGTISGVRMNGLKELTEQCYDLLAPMDSFHLLAGIRVNILEGGEKAQITAMSLVPFSPLGAGMDPVGLYFMSGGQHDFRAVKEKDGQWRLNEWHLSSKFIQGHPEIMPIPMLPTDIKQAQ